MGLAAHFLICCLLDVLAQTCSSCKQALSSKTTNDEKNGRAGAEGAEANDEKNGRAGAEGAEANDEKNGRAGTEGAEAKAKYSCGYCNQAVLCPTCFVKQQGFCSEACVETAQKEVANGNPSCRRCSGPSQRVAAKTFVWGIPMCLVCSGGLACGQSPVPPTTV